MQIYNTKELDMNSWNCERCRNRKHLDRLEFAFYVDFYGIPCYGLICIDKETCMEQEAQNAGAVTQWSE